LGPEDEKKRKGGRGNGVVDGPKLGAFLAKALGPYRGGKQVHPRVSKKGTKRGGGNAKGSRILTATTAKLEGKGYLSR